MYRAVSQVAEICTRYSRMLLRCRRQSLRNRSRHRKSDRKSWVKTAPKDTVNSREITKKSQKNGNYVGSLDRQKGCKSMKHGYNLLHQASGSAIVGLRIGAKGSYSMRR